jgi:hypothetical protein
VKIDPILLLQTGAGEKMLFSWSFSFSSYTLTGTAAAG